MENIQSGGTPQFSQIPDTSSEFNAIGNFTDNEGLQYYDESGNYRVDEFESLGGLHYMNYLHSHDDML